MIKTKEKKCKGTGQAFGYGCGKLTLHRIYGLGKSCCYSEWLFGSDAGKVKLSKAINSVQKPRKELEKARADKSIKNTLEALKKSVMTVCHKYIRLRDKYKPCISCNAIWNADFQAGHFYKAELYSNLKFNSKNINGQCRKCNLRKDGNEAGYRKGLLERFGVGHVNRLDKKALDYRSQDFKWDREKLKEERTIYNEMYNEIK